MPGGMGAWDGRDGPDHPGDGRGLPRGGCGYRPQFAGQRDHCGEGPRFAASSQAARAGAHRPWSPASIPSSCLIGWCPRAPLLIRSRSISTIGAAKSATFRMNVALDKLPNFTVKPGRGNHLTAGIIMAPSMDYMHRAHCQRRLLNGYSSQPVIEMLSPQRLDPSSAPKGKLVATLFCQHFRYKLPDGRSWDDVREKAADTIIATVKTHAPGFANRSSPGKSIFAARPGAPFRPDRRRYFPWQDGPRPAVQRRPMIRRGRLPLASSGLCLVRIGRSSRRRCDRRAGAQCGSGDSCRRARASCSISSASPP